MGKRDPRIDAYIANAAPFAQPILTRLRQTVHEACPEVEEGMKWRSPHFGYRGMLCGMAAFKEHCSFGFWKGELVIPEAERNGMGHFGKLTRVEELPSKQVLTGYIRKAMAINEQGLKVERTAPSKRRVTVPPVLQRALKQNRAARDGFENFSSSHQREYVEWIREAKTDETRQRRLATAIEWMAEGKPRNWKYMKR
jgi:uncharacterized protein YdeI (YjbR/CyaY-like superfamily)